MPSSTPPQSPWEASLLVDAEALAQDHVEQRGRVQAARPPLGLEAQQQGRVDAHGGVARRQ